MSKIDRRLVEDAPLTQAQLKSLLHYDPSTGIFTCLVGRRKAAVGSVAGVLMKIGYIQVTLAYKRYPAHRLAWFYMTGTWPQKEEIDHRDLDKTNNRWANLRCGTRAQNMQNTPRRSTNTSGYKGVSKVSDGCYRAYIVVGAKQQHLGCRKTPAEAHDLYVAAAKKLFGEFARAA